MLRLEVLPHRRRGITTRFTAAQLHVADVALHDVLLELREVLPHLRDGRRSRGRR